MNDARRKSTLPFSSDLHTNMRSGIPLPSTAKKQTNRISLAGPAIRNPYPAPPSTNPRNTMLRSQNTSSLLSSSSKQVYGKTPSNNNRRISLWASGSGTTPLPGGSQSQKDPRPIRERPFQSKERSDILNFCHDLGLDISMAQLLNIQSKDYRIIFEFLVELLDPCYPIDTTEKFEEIFIPALKSLGYPYAHSIDNKWLASVGSPHTWPHLLGVLHWLVEMCKMKEHYSGSGHPTLQDPDNVLEEFQDPFDRRTLAFDYYSKCYALWLDHIDEFEEPNEQLEDRYAKKNQRVQKDVEVKNQQLDEAKIECDILTTSAAPVILLKEENETRVRDAEKMQIVLKQWESRRKKLSVAIATEKTEIAKKEDYLAVLRSEQEQLDSVVKEQNLSPEEANRMTTEYEMLSRNIEDLKQKIADTEQTVMSLEVSLTNRISGTEETLHTYNVALSTLGLLPPLPPPHSDIDLTLELNTASSDHSQLLSGSDIRKVIKPTLNSIAESKRSTRAEVENERIKVDNEIEQLTLECDTGEDEISQLEKQVAAVNEQAIDLHNAAQRDALASSATARHLEQMVANARTAAIANGMGAKSRLHQLQFDYREQVERVNRLKDETVRAIIKNSSDIAEFRGEVTKRLRELRECAEME
ncbi:HEC/Ndc80p family-domain-containing protein [Lentinula lateritia]|uniref:HEC/Ndc80p family-domain-containing protein n=1 Tax=Lentinula aff. lateritia TaxID=2804960 RepID=A0ACC1TM10_9AGAR|nr:HEC/Ndc80p family-domain-containing protein [Lentinula aff. lateritia]KAJ3855624.1 HEC/Ndc80p family-domain-containing protein [Lentinula lateritia]